MLLEFLTKLNENYVHTSMIQKGRQADRQAGRQEERKERRRKREGAREEGEKRIHPQ